MTPANTPNPARRAAAGLGKHHKRLASDFSGNRLSARDIQAIFLTRRFRVRADRARMLAEHAFPGGRRA
jgi:hypothetical protein